MKAINSRYPDDVLGDMRQLAQAHGRSFNAEVMWALREYIRKEEFMAKQPVEWITEDQTFIRKVETRYIDEEGNRTKSTGAVHKGDNAGAERMLQAQLAGETPSEPYERGVHKVIRKGNEEGGEGAWIDNPTPRQKRDLNR